MKNAVLTVFSIMALAPMVHAGTYYVAVDGKPANDGSREKPWPSLEFALEKVKGGNTFIFRPGLYRGPIIIPDAYAGTEQAPTVIRSEEKWKAVVSGSPEHDILVGDHCNWAVVDGFELVGARLYGIKSDADHVTIRNCWIHNNVAMGLGAHHCKYSTFENNLIEFNGIHIQFDHGIYAGGDGLIIRGNVVRHNAGFGIHLYPEITNSQIYQNLIYGQEHHAGLLVVGAGDKGPNQVFQNTISAKSVALEIWKGNDTVVQNNILTVESGDPVVMIHGTKKVDADYNLCFPKSAHEEAHGISADPMFFKPHQGIFWLKTESPAIGKGNPAHVAKTDFWGRPTPHDAAPDLGAFAYTPWLLDPKSRTTWYNDWAYGYAPTPKGIQDMPELWVIPPEVPGEKSSEKPAEKAK